MKHLLYPMVSWAPLFHLHYLWSFVSSVVYLITYCNIYTSAVSMMCKYDQRLAQTVAISPVGMATVGELRCLTWLTQSPAKLGMVLGNLRQRTWGAFCWVTCLFSSFTFPQANQFTPVCSTDHTSWLSWASLKIKFHENQIHMCLCGSNVLLCLCRSTVDTSIV